MTMEAIGIELAPVERWFKEHVLGVTLPLRAEIIAGGRSNLTYRVSDDAGAAWVLRRPPVGQVLVTAHDMSREWRVLSGLTGKVPVPRPVAYCEDSNVTGAPFHVTEFVDGVVLRDADDASRTTDEFRLAASRTFAEGLAALHSVDPDAVGLGDLGKRTGYLQRQLARWNKQYESAHVTRVPELEQVYELLVKNRPDDGGQVTVVHADYRLDNAIFSPASELLAVVDWELCTLGDPLADLASLLIYWAAPGEPSGMSFDWPTSAGGFLDRSDMVSIYEDATGRDVSNLDYYLAFAHWRSASIGVGALARLVDRDGDATEIANMEDGTRYQIGRAAEAAGRFAGKRA
ncbi:MAG TPA: phosphotransferase family protein [Propionibacteriaceae bacterium]